MNVSSESTDDKPPVKEAWSGSHDPFSVSMPANHIFGMAEARVAKFCMQVYYIKCKSWGDRLAPVGMVSVT